MGFTDKKDFKRGDKVVVTIEGNVEVEGEVGWISSYTQSLDVKINGIEVTISSDSLWDVKKAIKPLPTARGAVIRFYGFAPYARGRYKWINLGSFKEITSEDLRNTYSSDFEVLFDGEGVNF